MSKSYFTMAAEAIAALKERGGSSPAAIKKYILANNKKLEFKAHFLKGALAKAVESGKFSKVKASYKLTPKAAPKKKVAPKKKPVKKTTKAGAKPKKTATKKTAAKKTATKKTPTKAKKPVVSPYII